MKESKGLKEQVVLFAKSVINLGVAEMSNTRVTELTEGLKQLIEKVEMSPVICVDYLQIIPSKGNKASSAKEKIDEVMLKLKDFRRETQATVIVISGFNRENY